MNVYFIDDELQQSLLFETKLKRMFSNINFTWLNHWYKLSFHDLKPYPDVIILDYQFKHGFRSYLLFDKIAELNIPTFLYTSSSKGEIIKDIRNININIPWPVNMKYCCKSDFSIFDKIKAMKSKLESKAKV